MTDVFQDSDNLVEYLILDEVGILGIRAPNTGTAWRARHNNNNNNNKNNLRFVVGLLLGLLHSMLYNKSKR